MPRALFEKTGNAVYISHLDLMRLFQRAFKRAGLLLTHTQGFSPRPSVSIALPMSVGVQSHCELLDFELDGDAVSYEEIKERLNETLVDGIRIREIYAGGAKTKDIGFLDCTAHLEYDAGVPHGAEEKLETLFAQPSLLVDKQSKKGITQQDIVTMIRRIQIVREDDNTLRLDARICCQEPALNPAQMVAAIAKYLPELTPDFDRYCRHEIYNRNEEIFR